MKLKQIRLLSALNMLEKNKVLADIGCDHGLLSIQYAFENYPTKVYAIDEKELPLKSCRENIVYYESKGAKLDNIELICSSGFKDVKSDCKQIVICGVGGDNIIDMFKENKNSLDNIDCFVFQPNNNSYFLRKYLSENSYKLVDEMLVKEDGIIYEIMKVKKGEEKLSEKEQFFGPIILKNKNELFIEKYSAEIKKLEKVLKKIPSNAVENIKKIESRINLIKEEM